MTDFRDLESTDGFSTRLVVRDRQHIFIAADDCDLWLCTATVPLGIQFAGMYLPPGDEAHTMKLIALLGMEWELIAERFDFLVDWQRMCLGHVKDNVVRALDEASAEEVLQWRLDLFSRTPGEFLRAQLTGDDPRAVSN